MIEIRPIDKKKWHDKKGKESFSQPQVIEAFVNPNTGRFETGLTLEEEDRLGKELGLDLSSTFNGTAHPFWSTKAAWVYLPNRTTLLDPQKPHDYLKIAICKASKYVANSLREYNENKYPFATHIIYDEEMEAEVDAGKVNKKQEAYGILPRLTDEDKANILQVITGKSARGKSPNYLNSRVGMEIEGDAAEFLRVAKMGREEVSVRAKVLELLFRNILTKDKGGIYYMGELIALNYEEAVLWFKDPNNSKMKVLILEKISKI